MIRRAFGSALLLSLVFACSTAPSRTPGGSLSTTLLVVDGTKITHDEERFELADDASVSASAPLVRRLRSALGAEGEAGVLLLESSSSTSVLMLLRVLLSAEAAGMAQVILQGRGTSIDLVLPDSGRAPPLAMADLFIMVEGNQATVANSLEEASGAKSGAESVELGSQREIRELLKRLCPNPASCTHLAMGSPAQLPFFAIEGMLAEWSRIVRERGTLRLLVSDSPVSSNSLKREAAGTLPRRSILEAIDREKPQFLACYREGGVAESLSGGTVTVRFTITKLGLVFDAEADLSRSTLSDHQIIECVVEAFTRTRFPKPEGGNVSFRHTVRF